MEKNHGGEVPLVKKTLQPLSQYVISLLQDPPTLSTQPHNWSLVHFCPYIISVIDVLILTEYAVDSLIFAVGNKDDDPEVKVVLREDAEKFADRMGIELFETSAKINKNVEEV